MKGILIVPMALTLLAGSASAGTACASGGSLDTYIADYAGFANACLVGDKLFYNFGYSASSTPAGNQPAASETVVIADPGDGFTNPGLIFSIGGFLVFPGETMDATIIYSVATLGGSAVLEDYSLSMAGSHTAQPSGLGSGSVTESFLNAPTGTPLVTTVGPNGAGIFSAHVDFLPWVSGTTVTTQIHLESPNSGPFDVVTISAIQEHFSEGQINNPEPYETILTGSGLILLGLWRKRRKTP